MSAYKTLKANTNVLDLIYWGVDNLKTAHEATIAIDYREPFKQEMDVVSGMINTIDDMCDYFFLLKWVQMKEVVPLLKTAEQREQLQSIIAIAKDKVAQFKKGDIIAFMNVHFAELLSAYETQTVTMDFILKMQSGINDNAFLYLAKEKAPLCIREFDGLKKKFQKDAELSAVLLQKSNLLEFLNYDYRQLYHVLEVFYCDVSFSDRKNIAEEAIGQLEEHFDLLLSKNNYDACISFSEAILAFYRFLVKIKHVYAKKESTRKKQIEEQEQGWLKNNGHKFQYSLPIKEIMDALQTERNPVKKIVLLTQRNNQEKQCLESHFEGAVETDTFMDLFAKESKNDTYFTYGRIQKNKLLLQLGSAVIHNIFLDKKLEDELVAVVQALLEYLQDSISINAQEMLNEIMMAFISIKEADDIMQKQQTVTCIYSYKARCYTAQMLLCASIEKLLRCFYKEKAPSYVSDSMIQLGGLVKDETIIQPTLGQGLMKAVGYELSRYGHIGNDLRNQLAHLNGTSFETLTIQKGYELYFLYLCVLNQLVYHVITNEQKPFQNKKSNEKGDAEA